MDILIDGFVQFYNKTINTMANSELHFLFFSYKQKYILLKNNNI